MTLFQGFRTITINVYKKQEAISLRKVNINQGWLFSKYGQEEKQQIDLPHDAMIHEKRDPNVDKASPPV